VGAGTGYYTAILAMLVGAGGHVDAYEIEADLAARAAANLSSLPQVSVHAQSALQPNLPAPPSRDEMVDGYLRVYADTIS